MGVGESPLSGQYLGFKQARVWFGTLFGMEPKNQESLSDLPVVELTRQLIRNRCVNDGSPESGHEHRSATTLIDFFGQPGTIVEPAPGRQSLVYRIPGTIPEVPSLALMGHIDVVPVTPSGWTVDPFAAEISEGMVWGRGAIDMLNLTAAMAAVFKEYLNGEHEPLPGDLLFLAVADEEAGGKLGAEPLVEQHWDLVRCDYLLTEIAYPPMRTADGGIAYPIAVGEKGPFWTKVSTRGEPGHGSMPYGSDNALFPMVEFLTRLFAAPTPVVITPLWREFVSGLGIPAEMADGLLNPERITETLAKIAEHDLTWASYAQACTHLTVSPNTCRGGVKANVVADRAEADIDIRVLPTQSEREVAEFLTEVLGELAEQVQIDPITTFESTISPFPSQENVHSSSTRSTQQNSSAETRAPEQSNPLWRSLADQIHHFSGSQRVLPTLMTAGTDGRFFRERGTVVYGAGMLDSSLDFSQFLRLFHGHDERVPLASLPQTQDYLQAVVQQFGQLSAEQATF